MTKDEKRKLIKSVPPYGGFAFKKQKDSFIEYLHREKKFLREVDGFYYYVEGKHGILEAWCLRVIADELDKLNESWNKQIDEYFDKAKKSQTDDPFDKSMDPF
jgi:hypothetical protein